MDILMSLENINANHVVDIIFSYFNEDVVRQMELVSPEWLSMIMKRKMWYKLFIKKATGDNIWKQNMELNSDLKKHLSPIRTGVDLGEIHLKYRRIYHEIEWELISVNNSWRAFAQAKFPKPTRVIQAMNSIISISLSDRMIIAGLGNGVIQIFNRQFYFLEQTLRGHQHMVMSLQSRGNTLVSGSKDTTIRIWKLDSGCNVNILTKHNYPILEIKLKGSFLFSNSKDNTMIVWTFHSAVDVRVLWIYRQRAMIDCFDFNKDFIYHGCRDGLIRVWRFSENTPPTTTLSLRGHMSTVESIRCNDEIFVSGCQRGIIRLWDVRNNLCLYSLNAHLNTVVDINICYGRLTSTGDDGNLHFWFLDQLMDDGSPWFRNPRNIFNPLMSCLDADYFALVSGFYCTAIALWNFSHKKETIREKIFGKWDGND